MCAPKVPRGCDAAHLAGKEAGHATPKRAGSSYAGTNRIKYSGFGHSAISAQRTGRFSSTAPPGAPRSERGLWASHRNCAIGEFLRPTQYGGR
ncbi:hypothetical protein VITFI_CDS0802 [Vitreoscilla filiformis]|uniref:Uncharacterized protein n=1 Tax=Vitreoscilla filiformis TaxID=63 RepID=A0A221KCL7_VITFI|nr:hypothetical protein VITFI_CDS0802 [Vitreoscilla filiformis]